MEETIHMLQNRIHQDKQQLEHLKSLLYTTTFRRKSTPHVASREDTYHHEKEGKVTRPVHVHTNPVFQSTFDAMDTYDDPHTRTRRHHQPTTERQRAMQHLFHQCQRRISKAEDLLDRASSEKSIRLEMASLRQCIEACLDEMKHRQVADERLTRILHDHLHDIIRSPS